MSEQELKDQIKKEIEHRNFLEQRNPDKVFVTPITKAFAIALEGK